MTPYQPERFELLKSIKKIPFNCTYLKLDRILQGDSDLISIQTVIESFQSIPASVTHLDLSYNELLFKNERELMALMTALPPSITHLDLRGNGCIDFQREGFSAQPIKLLILLTGLSFKQNLTLLDLRNNGFDTSHFDTLDEALIHPIKASQPFVDKLYLSSNEIICMSKTKLDRFAKLLPIAQDIHVTNELDQRITSNKINYLARQLVLTDARRSIQALALLDKVPDFPSDLTLTVMQQLLPKRDIDFCVKRLKIPLYAYQFFSSLSPIHDKTVGNKLWVHDNYVLRKELFYFFVVSQLLLLAIEPSIPLSLFVFFAFIQSASLVAKKFDLGLLNKINCPVELDLCSIGGLSGSDICIRFLGESVGEEPKVSCFFK